MIEVKRSLYKDEETSNKLDRFPQTKEALDALAKEVLHSCYQSDASTDVS
ncbi:MAG: hypothetical protein HPY61_12615 [Methanotrichaceae archaeon]|nr:hypothetical protein [Methanotrichaceae archaeon]